MPGGSDDRAWLVSQWWQLGLTRDRGRVDNEPGSELVLVVTNRVMPQYQ